MMMMIMMMIYDADDDDAKDDDDEEMMMAIRMMMVMMMMVMMMVMMMIMMPQVPRTRNWVERPLVQAKPVITLNMPGEYISGLKSMTGGEKISLKSGRAWEIAEGLSE